MFDMFDMLTTEVKKIIFSKIRYVDLYETSRVSKEWWTLSMASYKRTLKKDEPFLWFQVQFCTANISIGEEWTWWMLCEFTGSKSIELTPEELKNKSVEKMIAYFKRKGIQIQNLILSTGGPMSLNIKEWFPQLKALDLRTSNCDELVLPDKIKSLQWSVFGSHFDMKSVIRHPEHINSLCIQLCKSISNDNIRFDNLKHLQFNMMYNTTTVVKAFVTGSKQLRSISLSSGVIDEQWLEIFPPNIKKIELRWMNLARTLEDEFEEAKVFAERKLMTFLCQDSTKLEMFKSEKLQFFREHYVAYYLCRTQTMEEEIRIMIQAKEIPTGLLESGQFKLITLDYESTDEFYDFVNIVPKSVKHFIWNVDHVDDLSFKTLFEDASSIETIRIEFISETQIRDFPVATSLRSLDIQHVDHTVLESILSGCPSLTQLTLIQPEDFVFTEIPDLKSTSVKQLKLVGLTDSLVDVLSHFPCLEELYIDGLDFEEVIDEMKAFEKLKLVRIDFNWHQEKDLLVCAVEYFNELHFSHLVLGYRKLEDMLYCVVGEEKFFVKRFLASTHDYVTEISRRDALFRSDVLFFKGHSALFLDSYQQYETTYDLQEFISMAFK